MKQKLAYFFIILAFTMIGGYLGSLLYFTNKKHPAKLQEPGLSGAYEALRFWTRSRAYPGEDIPAETYFRQYEKVKSRLSKDSQSSHKGTAWQTMGPHNVSGRMISLALNPQNPSTLYAGSASGGLWRTFSAETGGGWHRIPTGFPVLGVMAIAIDPSDTSTIYIGTGEVYGYQSSIGGVAIHTTRGSYGIGILKTTDGGETWTKSLDWTTNQERGVQCLRMNPLNSNSLYAATSEGIYKTTNGGNTWVNVLPVIMGEDIVINTADTNKVMVSCGNFGSEGTGLYRSLDAGQNWTQMNQIPPYTGKTLLEMYGSNPDIIFATVADDRSYTQESNGLWRTDDFGTTWANINRQNIALWQGYYSHWVAVHPTDLNQIMQAGIFLNKSNDGGGSFEFLATNFTVGRYECCDHHAYVHHPTDPDVMYVAFDQGVARITGFGSDFQVISQGLQTTQFYNGFSSSAVDSNFALGGLQDNMNLIFDGSGDWQYTGDGDGGWNAVHPADDRIVYLSFVRNYILKSVNHGETFYAAVDGLEGSAAFVAPFMICPSNPNILYAGRKKVFKTMNNAEWWYAVNDEDLDGNFALSMAVSHTSPDVVYVGTAPTVTRAHLYRTLDGGESWDDVTNTLPDRYPMDLAVSPDNDRMVYVVFGGFGSGHVYKSTDAGDNWSDITGSLPDIPTLSIAVDPLEPDYVYIGNDIGVYVSQDAGTTWNTFMEGLPEAVIAMDLSISPSNRNLRVATHGNGVYQRPLLYEPETWLNFKLTAVHGVNLQGSEMIFGGTATNIGTETYSDIYTVKIRVTGADSGMEYFNSTTEISNLNPGVEQTFSFGDTFTAQDTGNYFVDFIKLGTSQQPLHDTLRQTMKVITLPTIAQASVEKKSAVYSEIQGQELNIWGDEGTEAVTLPFVFKYDGYDYDMIQIDINGWAELGYGDMNSERGLTGGGILFYSSKDNYNLGDEARPLKTLAPWWDDLDTGGEGSISYETIGSEPNRVFIVQWKNIRADSTYESSALVNFQLRLYEAMNTIEYHYGPVVSGTFSNEKAGASIGFKDHMGGDYHFYDVIRGGTGRTSDLITDLSPITDWPGPDSCFVIHTIPLKGAEWEAQSSGTTNNLYGVNAVSETNAWIVGVYGTVLHTTDGGETWDDVWTQSDTVHFYDVECIDDNTVLVLGYSIDTQSILTSHIYKTTDCGSSWILVYEENSIWLNDIEMFGLSEGFAVGDPVDHVWVMLTTTDAGDTWSRVNTAPLAADGEVSTPYAVCWVTSSIGWFGSNMSKAYRTTDSGTNWSPVDIPNYNNFMRIAFFETGIGLAASGDAFQRTTDNGNAWQSMTPPDNDIIQNIVVFNDVFWLLSEKAIYASMDQGLSWELLTSTTEKMQDLSLVLNGNELSGWAVGKNGSILYYKKGKVTTIIPDDNLPREIVLWQNYPNPFNPTTTIRYDLHSTGKVVLTIYNMVGQKVKTLVNETQTPGNKIITWDGRDDSGNLVSSGIYIYRLHAGFETQTKKMLFLK